MSWKNIKNFMIILLFIACAIVGAMLLLGGNKEDYTEDSLEKSAVLMEQSGIIIEPDQLRGSLDGMKIYRFTLPQDYPEKVAEKLVSGNVSDVFTVPGGVELRTDSGERLFVGSDFTVTYECSQERGISKDDLLLLLLPDCQSPAFAADSESDNGSTVIFTQTADGLPIPENTIVAQFDNGSLISFSGKWCFPDKCSAFSAPLRDYLNIMFTERERVSAENSEDQITLTVKSLEKCYGTEVVEGKSVFNLVPSLLIVYKEGEQAIHSAVAE